MIFENNRQWWFLMLNVFAFKWVSQRRIIWLIEFGISKIVYADFQIEMFFCTPTMTLSLFLLQSLISRWRRGMERVPVLLDLWGIHRSAVNSSQPGPVTRSFEVFVVFILILDTITLMWRNCDISCVLLLLPNTCHYANYSLSSDLTWWHVACPIQSNCLDKASNIQQKCL